IKSTVLRTRKSSLADLVHLGQERVNRFIEQGVATIEVKSGYGLDTQTEIKILKAVKKLNRARVVSTYLGPHAIPLDVKNSWQYLEKIITHDLLKIKKMGLASRVDIFVEEGFFSLEDMKKYFLKAQTLGFDLVGHFDQLSHS